MVKAKPSHDSLHAKVARASSPRYSYCLRCGMPWNRVKGHTTWYVKGSGCFPLCTGCWELLGHPEARIEYYKMLIDEWELGGSPVSEDTKYDIKMAVAAGG